MKKLLLPLLGLFIFGSNAYADTCAKGLMPLFTGPQAKELCDTFSAGVIGVLANNTYAVARNAANSANIDVWKVDATDDTVLNADSGDVIKLSVAGTSEVQIDNDSLTFTGAAASIIGGATSLTIGSAGSTIIDPANDAQRLITFSSSSDTALTIKFGDAGTTAAQVLGITASTSDADDDSVIQISGGGAFGSTRGGGFDAYGNEDASTPGYARVLAGNVANAKVQLINNVATGVIEFKPNGNTLAWTVGGTQDLSSDATNGGNVIMNAQDKAIQVLSGASLDADVTSVSAASNTVAYMGSNSAGGNVTYISNIADVNPVVMNFLKTRAAVNSWNANTIVTSSDLILNLNGYGADGVDYQPAASIRIQVDGTPGAGDMPGAINFLTTPDGSATPTQTMKIANTGIITLARAADLNFNVGLATIGLQEAVAGTACMGTLTCNGASDVTTSTTCATTGSRIFLTRTSLDTDTTGDFYVKSISNGVNFVVACEASDTATLNWIIFHESP